jgi:TolB-like protein
MSADQTAQTAAAAPRDASARQIVIRLHGAFSMTWPDGTEIPVRSTKLRAMLAMLATAAEGRRTRAWLQDTLWSRSGHEHGRASLRRALADLRRLMGEDFERLFEVTNAEIRLRPEARRLVGTPADGAFLEGMDIAEEGFEDWLRSRRQADRGDAAQADTAPALPAQARASRPAPLFVAQAPDRIQPALAILPLAAARGGDGAGTLGDMIAEELSRALSRCHMFDVISHLSCRGLDTRSVALAEIRQMLATDYVVAGTYRIAGTDVRVNADFIDARSGRIGWTREITADLRAFLHGDDTLVETLAGEIGRAVADSSVDLARTAPLDDVDTHALLISAITLMHRFSVASFSKAREQLDEVARRAPANPVVQAWRGKWHVLSAVQGWSTDLAADARAGRDHCARALDLQPDCGFALCVDGFVHNNLLHDHDTAMGRYTEAIGIDPNNALAWLLKGTLHAFTDEGALAVSHTDRARALSPLDPLKFFYDSLSAAAALSNHDYDKALELANRSMRLNPRHVSTLRARTVALQLLGRVEEARHSAEDLMRADPGLTVRSYIETHPAARFAAGQDWARAMRAAGVPY